ncbi:MAG: hypothetical protein ACLGH3_07725 [Actinomycetota bacterium]
MRVSRIVPVTAALLMWLPLPAHPSETPRDAISSQVLVATGTVSQDAFTYDIECTAGAVAPVDALFGVGRNDRSLWYGTLDTVIGKETTGDSVAILGQDQRQGTREVTRTSDRIQTLAISSTESNEVVIGQRPIDIVLVVAPIEGTFETCSISMDSEPLVVRSLPEASAGYVDLGGADRNAAWIQNDAGAFGYGTSESVQVGGGPFFASCKIYGSALIQATVFGTSSIDPIPATPIRSERCGGDGLGGSFAGRIDLFGTVNEAGAPSTFHWVSLVGY